MSNTEEVIMICGKLWIVVNGTPTSQTFTKDEIEKTNGHPEALITVKSNGY